MAEARNNAYSTAFIRKVKGTQKVHSVHTERYTNLGSYKGWTLSKKKRSLWKCFIDIYFRLLINGFGKYVLLLFNKNHNYLNHIFKEYEQD